MVYPCDKPCGNKTESGYCATTACINPQYSNIIGTVQYGQGVQKRTITNADQFRAMTDEELAAWCVEHFMCPEVRPWCKTREHGAIRDCKKCWIDWLKQEARE